MKSTNFLNAIKKTIQNVEPNSRIVFHGSRSRGDTSSDSDWDLLILLDGYVDEKRKDKIRYQLYDLELDSGEVISSIIINYEKWTSPTYQAMPFYKNVEREGIIL